MAFPNEHVAKANDSRSLSDILACCGRTIQGDHLSGKPGNVRDFDICQGNVRDFSEGQGNVREKLFIVSSIFVSIQVFSSIY